MHSGLRPLGVRRQRGVRFASTDPSHLSLASRLRSQLIHNSFPFFSSPSPHTLSTLLPITPKPIVLIQTARFRLANAQLTKVLSIDPHTFFRFFSSLASLTPYSSLYSQANFHFPSLDNKKSSHHFNQIFRKRRLLL